MDEKTLKRKLRSLKKQELRIRNGRKSVWDEYFGGKRPKYITMLLKAMDAETFRIVEDEYNAQVLYEYLNETGFSSINSLNPELLAILGLPYSADRHDVKCKFRQLAHMHHPDHGGDSDVFKKILVAYKELKE